MYTIAGPVPFLSWPPRVSSRCRCTAPAIPQASDLWRLLDQHFETFQQVYDERFAAQYGFWRPVVERSVTAFLKCGDLHQGFARVRCPDCHHEMFVAFSCKQRCTCPSCHQKRALLTAIHVAEEVCAPVAHRQVVLTIPKRLRLHTRFDRKLLGKLCACAWTCLQAEVRRLRPRRCTCRATGRVLSRGKRAAMAARFPLLTSCFTKPPRLDSMRDAGIKTPIG